MDSGFKYGKMAPSTKANGRTIKRMAKECSGTLMETFTRENSKTTNRTALEFFIAQTGQCTRVCGLTMCSTAKVRQAGQMAQVILETIRKEEEMELGLTSGLMATVIVANGLITPCAASVLTNGLMVVSMKALGPKILCTDKASMFGPTAESTMANMKMIRKMVQELSTGRTVANTQEAGLMASNMVKLRLQLRMANQEWVFGKGASVLAGSTNTTLTVTHRLQRGG